MNKILSELHFIIFLISLVFAHLIMERETTISMISGGFMVIASIVALVTSLLYARKARKEDD